MNGEQRSGRPAPPRREPDIYGALDALTGEECKRALAAISS
jgi:hypothetical protein